MGIGTLIIAVLLVLWAATVIHDPKRGRELDARAAMLQARTRLYHSLPKDHPKRQMIEKEMGQEETDRLSLSRRV